MTPLKLNRFLQKGIYACGIISKIKVLYLKFKVYTKNVTVFTN